MDVTSTPDGGCKKHQENIPRQLTPRRPKDRPKARWKDDGKKMTQERWELLIRDK